MENNSEKYDLGMIGLGVMGRNLVYNMFDKGYSVAGYDKDGDKVEVLGQQSDSSRVRGEKKLESFLDLLKSPRSIMMMVPAGKIVDSVIEELLPHLEKDDLIIDGGNSHFTDTNRRYEQLEDKGIHFIGVGISGGEKGARYGPSMMPGGSPEAYARVRKLFEAVSAKVSDVPCVTYLGKDSAGHYVKMVHNGIEYAFMQLIAESYHLLKEGLGLTEDDLHGLYKKWNEGKLRSFLMEITADIFCQPDPDSDHRLINVILDAAKQKGTGKWTSQDAMELQVPVPSIDMAVFMRDLSVYKHQRQQISKKLPKTVSGSRKDDAAFPGQIEDALYVSLITIFAQGFELMRIASEEYEYNLRLADIARIWRGGCIIRADLLEDIRSAFSENPDLSNLLLSSRFDKRVRHAEESLRTVVRTGTDLKIPVPGFMAALSYLDGYRSDWLPANLIQAQRDYFGSHTYERIDEKGVFHTKWLKSKGDKDD